MSTVALPYTPRAHQRLAHAAIALVRFAVLVWHRGAGKTVFSIVKLVMAALQTRDGRYGYIAPYLKQAKGVAWDYLKAFTQVIPGAVPNESELSVALPNGARVRLFGADNAEALRGIHWHGVVLDEVADMDPQVWSVIVRPALGTHDAWALFIGTPKGVNLFSELYYAALKTVGWHAEIRRASETGVFSQAELESMKATMAPSQYAQEMECDFAAAVDNVLLRLDEVLAAQRRAVTENELLHAPKVLGVDVARYGDDRTVIQPRQGPAAMAPVALRSMDTMEVSGRLALAIDRWGPDAVFVDAGGVGAGVVDRMRQLGYPVIGVDFGGKSSEPRFENKRAQMWWLMAEWVRAGGCLPEVREYQLELPGPTFTYANARGRLQLESKDDMRKRGLPSPDYADALALTFAEPVAMRGLELPRHLRKHDRGDYDPFSQGQHDYDPFTEGRL